VQIGVFQLHMTHAKRCVSVYENLKTERVNAVLGAGWRRTLLIYYDLLEKMSYIGLQTPTDPR